MGQGERPKIRLVGAVLTLALVVDAGDGGDLQPLKVEPLQLSPQAFREFDLEAEMAKLENQIGRSEA